MTQRMYKSIEPQSYQIFFQKSIFAELDFAPSDIMEKLVYSTKNN